MSLSLRRFVFGSPLRTERAAHERLSIPLALPVFAADALSSVAYATEAILITLAEAKLHRSTFSISIPISIGIIVLILMVVVSYWQTIHAYPNGGGSYIVSKDNLGSTLGLIAAAALLVDYILTVSVSVAESVKAALAALSTVPSLSALENHRVVLCVVGILLVMLINLRGVRESGLAFAIPAYFFIAMMLLLVAVGFYRMFVLHALPLEPVSPPKMDPMLAMGETAGTLSIFLVLRAFSSGCAALTGIEAVSNGVQAFKKPEADNASKTLVILGVLLAIIFISLTFLADHYKIVPTDNQTTYGGTNGHEPVVSQVARAIFGTGLFYYFVQAATAMILFLAANTAFADFPRLSSILARDGYLPRYFANLGDRLAFNNGIMVLSFFAILFIVIFKGETHALLPLYTVGVFIAFTLSQAGMVVHWRKLNKPGLGMIINGFGCLITGVVFCVVFASKIWVPTEEATLFHIGSFKVQEGAWISFLLMGAIWQLFRVIKYHYVTTDARLAEIPEHASHPFKHTVIVLVGSRMHRGIVTALNYARSISPDAVAVHISLDAEHEQRLREQWEMHGGDTPLIVLDSPYRTLYRPLMEYLDAMDQTRNDDIITVVLPEFVPIKWWHTFLHNATGWSLRLRLFYRRNVVITSVRYYLEEEELSAKKA